MKPHLVGHRVFDAFAVEESPDQRAQSLQHGEVNVRGLS
jgi:hypothetical protein